MSTFKEQVPMIESDPDTRWYALHVRSNYEMTVANRLDELGVEHYLPLNKSSKVTQRNKFPLGPPLFPGYVFSFIDLHAGPRLYSIPGIIRVLGFGGRATPIGDNEVAMMRTIAQSPLPVESIPYFNSGDRICLTAGPLAGVSGTFLSSTKGNKLVVSLPLLKRSLAVTVLAEWVTTDPKMYSSAEAYAS
jgi:transcription antitermination factor NusG